MIFATVAIVCTMSECNNYVIETSDNAQDAAMALRYEGHEFAKAWSHKENEGPLNAWLNKYQIGETIFEIVSVDIETQEIQENDIP